MRPPIRPLVLAILTALAFAPTAEAETSVTACDGPNEAVLDDVSDTLANPTHPECGSLSEPCFTQGWSCYGCGPDVVEWIVGPIYCV